VIRSGGGRRTETERLRRGSGGEQPLASQAPHFDPVASPFFLVDLLTEKATGPGGPASFVDQECPGPELDVFVHPAVQLGLDLSRE
jgi:hypothetical protein